MFKVGILAPPLACWSHGFPPLWNGSIIDFLVWSLRIWQACDHKVSRVVLVFLVEKSWLSRVGIYKAARDGGKQQRGPSWLSTRTVSTTAGLFSLVFVWAKSLSERSHFLCSSNNFSLFVKSRNISSLLERSSGVTGLLVLLFISIPHLLFVKGLVGVGSKSTTLETNWRNHS